MTQHLTCDTLPLFAICDKTKATIQKSLCWFGRDFHKKLVRGNLTESDGTIAMVREGERLIGWARSEMWTDDDGAAWPTLEAFVHVEHRRRGVAAFATAGLVVSVFGQEGGCCAVFAPSMLVVACRAGLRPSLFQRDGHGQWRADEH